MTTKFTTGFMILVLLVSLTGCAKKGNQLPEPSQTDIRLKQVDFSNEMEGAENWMGKPAERLTQV